jgi:hypothetical protein
MYLSSRKKSKIVPANKSGRAKVNLVDFLTFKGLKGAVVKLLGVCATLLVVAVSALIFYGCKKDDTVTQTETSVTSSWSKSTDFDLNQFVTFPDFKIGEFHNDYLDYIATTSIFPNQTAYNQYELICGRLPDSVRATLEENGLSAELFGETVNNALQMNGFDGLINTLPESQQDIVPYFEQMKQHFTNEMPNNFINGDINNTLDFLLNIREQVLNDITDVQVRNVMLVTLEIAAYSSVYWYGVTWAEDSPWDIFLIDDVINNGDEPLVMGNNPGRFKRVITVVLRICAVVAADVVGAVAGDPMGGITGAATSAVVLSVI